MFDQDDQDLAARLITRLKAAGHTVCTAESCTGGLIAALLTEIPGSSAVVDRGFVTYSNAAKCELLGVPPSLLGRYGAVSAEVAAAMVSGALRASTCDLAIAVTGVAGPGGGSPTKPVGLVHIAAQTRGKAVHGHQLNLGPQTRSAIRLETVRAALSLALQAIDADGSSGVKASDEVP